MHSFCAPELRSLLRHLVHCSRELISRDQGSTSVRPYTASTVLLHWWVAQTWRSLFPFYTSNTFIILSVLNISMSYSLLNICLFPFLNKLMRRPKSLRLEFFSLSLILKIEIGLEVWFLQDVETNYRPSSLDLRQMLGMCWREMQDKTYLDAE